MNQPSKDLINAARLSWILPLSFLVTAAATIRVSTYFHSNGVIALILILILAVCFYVPAIKFWIRAWVLAEPNSKLFLHALIGLVFLVLPFFVGLIAANLPGK